MCANWYFTMRKDANACQDTNFLPELDIAFQDVSFKWQYFGSSDEEKCSP